MRKDFILGKKIVREKKVGISRAQRTQKHAK